LFLFDTAAAKLNLGLHVLRKRSDGFHDIETVFVKIGWEDTIFVESDGPKSAATISMTCDRPELSTGEDNLCIKAAKLLREHTGCRLGAKIRLEKKIPMGAGLGGGSSDAATTLALLNRLWGLELPVEELSQLGAQLGSDVPAFLHPMPAFASGRGVELSAVTNARNNDLLAIPYWFAVIKPEVHVSTGAAYGSVRPNDKNRPDLQMLVQSLDLDRWKFELVNDFEEGIAAAYPDIEMVRRLLVRSGAVYASMSGSGSAVFGVYESESSAKAAFDAANEAGLSAWYGKTR